MTDSRLQKQRFEYKYITDEVKALGLRHFVESYLDLDDFGALQPDRSYPIHSIYLDSNNLKTYTDTINGNRNRYKLRVRYYENGPEAPVYLEIKRRHDKVIAKKRAIVHRNAVQEIMNRAIPSMDYLVNPGPDQFEALYSFCKIATQLEAAPKTHIAYRREAYELNDSNAVRVTFDRQVLTEAVESITFSHNLDRAVSVFGSDVIVELKFTDRYPRWFRDLVQKFNLRNGSAAKYVDGLVSLHTQRHISLNYW